MQSIDECSESFGRERSMHLLIFTINTHHSIVKRGFCLTAPQEESKENLTWRGGSERGLCGP